MRKINEIIIHCTATPSGREVSVETIDKWHRERGFSGIGYHYVVHLDGSVSVGRDIRCVGAHCLNHNHHSVGVCYVGGLSASGSTSCDTRTPSQKLALSSLISTLRARFGNIPVHGHRDFANKSCPCFDASNEYNS